MNIFKKLVVLGFGLFCAINAAGDPKTPLQVVTTYQEPLFTARNLDLLKAQVDLITPAHAVIFAGPDGDSVNWFSKKINGLQRSSLVPAMKYALQVQAVVLGLTAVITDKSYATFDLEGFKVSLDELATSLINKKLADNKEAFKTAVAGHPLVTKFNEIITAYKGANADGVEAALAGFKADAERATNEALAAVRVDGIARIATGARDFAGTIFGAFSGGLATIAGRLGLMTSDEVGDSDF